MVSISIIIPIYNVEPYIAECLQSVMRQTYRGPMECILVDDCGTDSSMEVAEKVIAGYAGPIGFKILHHEHNRGLSAARNTGMDAAIGEYVYFLDSDDWISDDCIEELAKPLQEEKVDIVVGDYVSVGFPPCTIKLSLPEGKYHEKEFAKTFCNGGVYVMAVNKLYGKEFMYKYQLRFEEGKIHEDEILAFELSCLEKTFYVVKSVTYNYRIRENSIMTGADQVKKANGYIGILQSVAAKVQRYSRIEGIYDFYLWWVKHLFGSISWNLDEDTRNGFIDRQVEGYLDAIPNVCRLKDKHNRLLYFACRKKQSFSRYLYVSNVYSDKLQGRLLRNVLNLLPYKH